MLYYRDFKGTLCSISIKHQKEKILSDVGDKQAAMKAQLKSSSPVLYLIL